MHERLSRVDPVSQGCMEEVCKDMNLHSDVHGNIRVKYGLWLVERPFDDMANTPSMKMRMSIHLLGFVSQ